MILLETNARARYVVLLTKRILQSIHHITPKLEKMTNYITAKNDRIRRRKAGFLTAVITLSLLAYAAYSFGAFDAYFAPDAAEMITTTVARV